MLDAAERPESFSVRERDLRRANLTASRITFYFASAATQCGSLSFDITGGIPR